MSWKGRERGQIGRVSTGIRLRLHPRSSDFRPQISRHLLQVNIDFPFDLDNYGEKGLFICIEPGCRMSMLNRKDRACGSGSQQVSLKGDWIMAAIVLLSLPMCLLALGTLMAVAFINEALTTQYALGGAVAGELTPRWFPSVSELSKTSERLTGESNFDLTHLICPPAPFVPRVTEPEANAIAAEIQRRGTAEVNRVLKRSHGCNGACPMRLSNGQCDCSTVRPLNCIGRCQTAGEAPEWVAGLGDSLSMAFRDHLQSRNLNAESRPLDEALVSLLVRPQSAMASRN